MKKLCKNLCAALLICFTLWAPLGNLVNTVPTCIFYLAIEGE